MKLQDIIDSIIKTIDSKNIVPNLEIFDDDIKDLKRPAILVELVDYKTESLNSTHTIKSISIDILCFLKGESVEEEPKKSTLYDFLDKLDTCFDVQGVRRLTVLDRCLGISLVNSNIVDKIGHYMLDIEFYDDYGNYKETAILMNELELKINNGGSN
ncbi:MAG: phage tail terminator family protein [Fusobacteriaceae bacterium]